jgi:cytosine/creatinine deaminase
MVADAGGNLGCVTRLVHSDHENGMPADLQDMLDNFFKLAEERNLDLDFHVDEGGDPRAVALGFIARTAIKRGFKGKIVTGHCCSLSIQPDQLVKDTLDACADSGLAVASMPTCNMYVQARNTGITPRWRGVTLLHELRARGVTVTVGSDNTRDSFHEFGDLDMHDTYNQAVRIAHLDYPHTDWPRVVTRTPADVMRLPELGRIKPGMTADLILFHARSMSELLARPQSDRIVLRAGRPIDRKLPDYRELDDLQRAL